MKRKIKKPRIEYKRVLSDKEINKDLENIYEDENGEVPNMARLEPRKTSRFLRFFLYLGIALLILAAVSWSGFYIFNRYAPESIQKLVGDTGNVQLEIKAAEELASGKEITYLIKYKNNKKVVINNVQLNIRYPSGLVIEELEPQPLTKDGDQEYLSHEDNWDMGSVKKGEEGEIKIKGKLVAEIGINQNLWAVLYYEPANFTSKFQVEASWTTTIKSIPVEVTVSGPESLAPRDLVELTLEYKNNEDQDLENVLIEVIYPENFNLESTEPEPSQREGIWQFATLAKDEKGEIEILGKFAATTSGSQDFIIKTLIKEGEEDYYLLQEQVFTIEVFKGELITELRINGSTEDGIVNFGDFLNYSLTFENSGDQTLSDLEASVFFTSTAEFISWTTLADRYEGFLDEFEAGKLITWTAEEVSNLEELKPGDKGIIDFSVKIVSMAGDLSGDLSLQNIASIKIGKVGGKEVSVENKSNKIIIKVNSNLNLEASARYFDDHADAIGSGPLPPRVDQTTTYVVTWLLSNSVHEVQDIVVFTTLPEKVSWVAKRDISVGEVEYQPEDRKVVWTINRLPTTLNLEVRVSFRISITPNSSDLGKILALSGDHNLSALDKETGVTINKVLGAITTDLVNDPVGKGKGLVEE